MGVSLLPHKCLGLPTLRTKRETSPKISKSNIFKGKQGRNIILLYKLETIKIHNQKTPTANMLIIVEFIGESRKCLALPITSLHEFDIAINKKE